MYAIRSYYGSSATSSVRALPTAYRSFATASVITSYSIHYTKLYDALLKLGLLHSLLSEQTPKTLAVLPVAERVQVGQQRHFLLAETDEHVLHPGDLHLDLEEILLRRLV